LNESLVLNPSRIVAADICRDGGTYVMHVETQEGANVEFELRVHVDAQYNVDRYEQLTVLDYADADRNNRRLIDWGSAIVLADRLDALLDDKIGWGGRNRAVEMIAFVRSKGDVAAGCAMLDGRE
jgi:hypothetical protein